MEHEEDSPSRFKKIGKICAICVVVLCFGGGLLCLVRGLIALISCSHKDPVPSVELASMSFTVLNITETRLSAKWDLSIRIPETLPYWYICLQGDFQASFLYKNVTLATSSPQKYSSILDSTRYFHRYHRYVPQILTVSTVVSGKDIDGLIGKDIMEDIKEKKEVKFVSWFFLTDCRQKTTGTMSYACPEATLRFEPGSEMKATVFGEHPSCINI